MRDAASVISRHADIAYWPQTSMAIAATANAYRRYKNAVVLLALVSIYHGDFFFQRIYAFDISRLAYEQCQ